MGEENLFLYFSHIVLIVFLRSSTEFLSIVKSCDAMSRRVENESSNLELQACSPRVCPVRVCSAKCNAVLSVHVCNAESKQR